MMLQRATKRRIPTLATKRHRLRCIKRAKRRTQVLESHDDGEKLFTKRATQ